MIRVRTLGQCTIQIDTFHVGPDAEIVFASLLLLTVERGRRVGRGELLGMLWPATPASRASHCLRQTIYRLRTLGVPLEVDRTHLVLSPSVVDSDVDAVLRASRTDDIERLADRVSGPFLPGYSPSFSEPLRDWVERQRDLVSAGARRVLVGAIALRKSRGEWADVERLAHQCLAIDPLNEDATLALAEAAALHGGKVEAMGILDRYLREMGLTARELRVPAMALRRRISEPALEFPLAPPLHVPFVGRSAEMATLANALRSARGGAGTVHFIHGEPGIGKTRLLTEFTRAAALDGARVAPALCQASDSRRPLSVFVDVVPKLMAMPGALGCSPESHRYLRRFIEHHSSEEPPTPDASEAAVLFANVRRSLFDLLDAIASEASLLITIEDVHWLDPASWEIVAEAASWIDTRRMMLVLTSRDHEQHYAPVIDASPHILRSLWLGPIDRSARERLFAATLCDSRHAVTEPFRDWCVEMSGGNPYYLRELALHGLDARGQFEVPPSLATLVAQRVARLRPVSCRVLQACAILGKNATLDRIEGMLDQPRMDLLDAYDELEQGGLLSWNNGNLVCHHDLLLEAALDRASRTVSSYLHRRAAMTLAQSLRQDCQVSLAWECAKHLLSAGEPSKAAAQLMDCARHALELGRPMEADEILAGSLELPLSGTERTSVLNERAHALRAADRWDDVVGVLSEVVAAQSQDGRIQHTDQELQLVSAKWAAGHDANCLLSSLRDCCRQRASTSSHRLLAARWAFMLADNTCEAEIAHDIYRLVSADLCSDSSGDFDRTYCRMIYNAAFGDIAEAERAARELDAVLQDRSDIREVCLARTHVAEVLKEAGHVQQSVALLHEAYHVAVANSLLWLACLAGRRLAWRCIDSGDYAAAAEWVDAVLPMSERIQHIASRADALGAAAELALHRGETAQAAELLTRSAAAWRDTRHARTEAACMASQSAIWLAEGNLAACKDALPRFMELYRRVRRHSDQDQTTARLVRVLECTNQLECAEGLLHEYLGTHRRGRAPLSVELAAICERKGLPLPASLKEPVRTHAPAA